MRAARCNDACQNKGRHVLREYPSHVTKKESQNNSFYNRVRCAERSTNHLKQCDLFIPTSTRTAYNRSSTFSFLVLPVRWRQRFLCVLWPIKRLTVALEVVPGFSGTASRQNAFSRQFLLRTSSTYYLPFRSGGNDFATKVKWTEFLFIHHFFRVADYNGLRFLVANYFVWWWRWRTFLFSPVSPVVLPKFLWRLETWLPGRLVYLLIVAWESRLL